MALNLSGAVIHAIHETVHNSAAIFAIAMRKLRVYLTPYGHGLIVTFRAVIAHHSVPCRRRLQPRDRVRFVAGDTYTTRWWNSLWLKEQGIRRRRRGCGQRGKPNFRRVCKEKQPPQICRRVIHLSTRLVDNRHICRNRGENAARPPLLIHSGPSHPHFAHLLHTDYPQCRRLIHRKWPVIPTGCGKPCSTARPPSGQMDAYVLCFHRRQCEENRPVELSTIRIVHKAMVQKWITRVHCGKRFVVECKPRFGQEKGFVDAARD